MGKLSESLKGKMSFWIRQSSKQRDYRYDCITISDFLIIFAESLFVTIMISYFFYRSVFALLPMSVVGVCFFKKKTAEKRVKSREILTCQFKECILSVTNSMRAGYAVENAFLESRADMKMLYGENSMIYQELELMRRGMVINITLEELLTDLALRSGSEEIQQFAQIFAIAKRSGGNLPEIIRASVELIGQKIETKEEIYTLLSGRKMEQNIMKIVPFGILIYIGISYPGYFNVLYGNLPGTGIMTACLFLYLTAYVLGEKVMNNIEKKMM